VLEAKDLIKCDSGKHTSDPYCVVSVERTQHYHTQVVKNTLNPKWGETFNFNISESSGEIVVSVYDWDSVGKHDFMGRIKFMASHFTEEKAHRQWFKLHGKEPDNIHRGELYLDLFCHWAKAPSIPFDGNTNIFGVPLEVIGSRLNAPPIPATVADCANYLKNHGIKEQGIFRLSGSAQEIKSLQQAYDSGKIVSLVYVKDHNTISGLLKLFIRSLPNPLLTHELYDKYIEVGKADLTEDKKIAKYKDISAAIMPANKVVAEYFFKFLHEVSQHVTENLMGPENLSIVFGPVTLSSKSENLEVQMSNVASVNHVVCTLITHANVIFS